jgi:hypothetical protein
VPRNLRVALAGFGGTVRTWLPGEWIRTFAVITTDTNALLASWRGLRRWQDRLAADSRRRKQIERRPSIGAGRHEAADQLIRRFVELGVPPSLRWATPID